MDVVNIPSHPPSPPLSDLPFGLEGSHPQCYKKETSTAVRRDAGRHGKIKTHTHSDRQSYLIQRTNTLTVCDAEVSGTPSGLSPAWGTHTDLLKHTCTGSVRERREPMKSHTQSRVNTC